MYYVVYYVVVCYVVCYVVVYYVVCLRGIELRSLHLWQQRVDRLERSGLISDRFQIPREQHRLEDRVESLRVDAIFEEGNGEDAV